MNQAGYYRYPTIWKDTIVFVSEDDLWSVPSKGGQAKRLTSNLNQALNPVISPNGKWIAYVGWEEGDPEIYIMPREGGPSTRLTYTDQFSPSICGWTKDSKEVIVSSSYKQPFLKSRHFYKIPIEGGLPVALNIGYGHHLSFGPNGKKVLGRNTFNRIARWKRYRGGTAGKLWIDAKGDDQFKLLKNPTGNFESPMWIGSRIYFLSDHEGISNLYSIRPSGQDIQKHTDHKEYFARNANTDGKQIVYHAGGDIFTYDTKSKEHQKVKIDYKSSFTQRQSKFVQTEQFMEHYDLHPDGHSLAITARGKGFVMGNWEGSVLPVNAHDGIRQRLFSFLNTEDGGVYISDEGGDEHLCIIDEKGKTTALKKIKFGRAVELKVSPDDKYVALSNQRYEMVLIDLKKKKSIIVEECGYGRVNDFDWSKDGQWLAYSSPTASQAATIKIHSTVTGKTESITEGDFIDYSPTFDPEGKYLYFLSNRVFNPVYDSHYFDLNFPKGVRPYVISLQNDNPNPFVAIPKSLEEDDDFKPNKKNTKVNKVKIDFKGIKRRIAQFPVAEGNYVTIKAAKEKVLFSNVPVMGSLEANLRNPNLAVGRLQMYDFEKQQLKTIVSGMTDFKLSSKSETLIYRSSRDLRVCSIKNIKSLEEDGTSRLSGWIDLDRIKVSVDPTKEWQQIFDEIWRLQNQHFWTETMSGVDWNRVYKRYAPLVSRLSSRGELSDLAWEMQGELGTSHAYEMGGDYKKGPGYHQGFLGADFVWDKRAKAYKITHIVEGDEWLNDQKSPLNEMGVNAKIGDFITAINGRDLDEHTSPHKLLINLAAEEVSISIKDAKTKKIRYVTVKTLASETQARYREWVEANRAYVHKKTNGKVGYVHVPNMGPWGYSEFHRYYANESQKDALIVDVRYNGGGHVSQLLLEKLARKRIGYDMVRWGKELFTYPSHAVGGPIVAVTNEYAGSDGDIFSHCFKLMNLGDLIGTRTWGGVIGIWPRHSLIDGGITTQPEFSFWFTDVGFGVENYGTDPTIEVHYAPQDHTNGIDPQMDKAIAHVKEQMKKQPNKLPDFGPLPDLSLPT